jgi:hypothetical protein
MAMERKTLLSSEVKRVLSGVSDHGAQHLTEIEADLVQTNVLLTEAIDKLGASFMAIHAAVTTQQEAVSLLLSGAAATPELAERLHATHRDIDRHVGAAITGLQFQDMTSQLIHRTLRRVTGLREVLGGVGSGSSVMPPECDIDHIIDTLHAVSAALHEQSQKLESELWKAVRQTHMESGDIELF